MRERDKGEGQGQGQAQGQGGQGQAQGQGVDEFQDLIDGPINMDHYWSTRRRPRTPTWPYVVSAVVMLILLVAIVMYQDSCGASVSGVLFSQ